LFSEAPQEGKTTEKVLNLNEGLAWNYKISKGELQKELIVSRLRDHRYLLVSHRGNWLGSVDSSFKCTYVQIWLWCQDLEIFLL